LFGDSLHRLSVEGALIHFARIAVVIAFAGLLAACVTATPYQPAPPRGFGYSEERLDQNKYRVTFRGNSLTKRETVEDYLLYRAAELTLQNGYSHFLIIGRDTEAKTRYRYWIDLMAAAAGFITGSQGGTGGRGTTRGGRGEPMRLSR
jgi:hypothetical protein